MCRRRSSACSSASVPACGSGKPRPCCGRSACRSAPTSCSRPGRAPRSASAARSTGRSSAATPLRSPMAYGAGYRRAPDLLPTTPATCQPRSATMSSAWRRHTFACAVDWYETIGIGVPGGAIDALVRRHLGDPFFGVGLNPGHLLHLDEWLNTPIYLGKQRAAAVGPGRFSSTSSRRPARRGSPRTSRMGSRFSTSAAGRNSPTVIPRHGPASRLAAPSWPTSSASG